MKTKKILILVLKYELPFFFLFLLSQRNFKTEKMEKTVLTYRKKRTMKRRVATTFFGFFIAFSTIGQIVEVFGIKNIINQKNMKSLKIERHFSVSPERIFAIFTHPEEMIVWWTPETKFDIDLQVGGNYTITREDNGITYRMTGKYLEVEKPNKLRYTCAMPDFSPITDTITIEIQANGKGGSKMTFIQEGEGIDAELKELPEETISESEKGWQMGFDLMEQYWKNK